jgi:hypothetical protein
MFSPAAAAFKFSAIVPMTPAGYAACIITSPPCSRLKKRFACSFSLSVVSANIADICSKPSFFAAFFVAFPAFFAAMSIFPSIPSGYISIAVNLAITQAGSAVNLCLTLPQTGHFQPSGSLSNGVLGFTPASGSI